MLLIDEFNRADMNKAFGEMFRAIDHGRIELKPDENPPDSLMRVNDQLDIPKNVIAMPDRFRIVCTMNDYDKSNLNELSYGLLRRFAFVTIDGPGNKEAIKRIVSERVLASAKDIDPVKAQAVIDRIQKDLLDKFVDFIILITEKRNLGVSTLIDVIKYVVVGTIVREEPNDWKLLGEALVDYILPQLDRLDSVTLIAVREALVVFKLNDKLPDSIIPFADSLDEMIKKIQTVGELFSK
jgi:hypothetical protein